MAQDLSCCIYLRDGTNDIDDVCGNWTLANQQMAAALKFRGYDYFNTSVTGVSAAPRPRVHLQPEAPRVFLPAKSTWKS